MGKRKVWQKMLALLLALSMVFSTQTMSVFADVVGVQTVPSGEADSQEQELQAGTEESGQQGEIETFEDEDIRSWIGIVSGENVNLRETPDAEADNVVAQVENGQELTVTAVVTLENGDQWGQI